MERKFKTGDVVVRLASDTEENTPMTVRGYADEIAKKDPTSSPFMGDFKAELEGLVRCDWRDKFDVPHQKDYYEDELVKC